MTAPLNTTDSTNWLTLAWGVVATVSVAASAYHGYKRNQSIGWALLWGLAGGVAPVITPAIALAQGFGEPGPEVRLTRLERGQRLRPDIEEMLATKT